MSSSSASTSLHEYEELLNYANMTPSRKANEASLVEQPEYGISESLRQGADSAPEVKDPTPNVSVDTTHTGRGRVAQAFPYNTVDPRTGVVVSSPHPSDRQHATNISVQGRGVISHFGDHSSIEKHSEREDAVITDAAHGSPLNASRRSTGPAQAPRHMDASAKDISSVRSHTNNLLADNAAFDDLGGPVIMDHDLEMFSKVFDNVTAQMKKEVTSSFLEQRKKQLRHQSDLLEAERKKSFFDQARKQDEIEAMKEELAADQEELKYRHLVMNKMANLVAIKQDRIEGLKLSSKCFIAWKSYKNSTQRLKMCDKWTEPFYRKTLLRKVMNGWRNVSRDMRRAAIDKFWQDKLENISGQLVRDYEHKLNEVRMELDRANEQLNESANARLQLEEDLKKAFMRGVCALNLEAMQIMKKNGGNTSGDQSAEDVEGYFQKVAPAVQPANTSVPALSSQPLPDDDSCSDMPALRDAVPQPHERPRVVSARAQGGGGLGMARAVNSHTGKKPMVQTTVRRAPGNPEVIRHNR